MANTKEIKNHISSVKDTQKITNAMYLIASTKLQKAKEELNNTRPYFNFLQTEIKRILRTVSDVKSPYFYPSTGEHDLKGSYGYLIITANKGLAGAYNQSVLKMALSLMDEHDDNKFFIVGEYGRRFFKNHNIPIEEDFNYSAQDPTIQRARNITAYLLDLYNRRKLSKIFVIYTDYSSGLLSEPKIARILPFHPAQFKSPEGEETVKSPFEFQPSVEDVINNMIPGYVTGFVYSALVDSFCSEQNSRMAAMDAANKNAQELLNDLSLKYNHIRQGTITQEITEIASGAKVQKAKKHK